LLFFFFTPHKNVAESTQTLSNAYDSKVEFQRFFLKLKLNK